VKWQNEANRKRATISMRECGARDEVQPEVSADVVIEIGRTKPIEMAQRCEGCVAIGKLQNKPNPEKRSDFNAGLRRAR
jgi:hypothetical protein